MSVPNSVRNEIAVRVGAIANRDRERLSLDVLFAQIGARAAYRTAKDDRDNLVSIAALAIAGIQVCDTPTLRYVDMAKVKELTAEIRLKVFGHDFLTPEQDAALEAIVMRNMA